MRGSLLQNLGDARHLHGRVAQRTRPLGAVRTKALATAAILEQRRQLHGERPCDRAAPPARRTSRRRSPSRHRAQTSRRESGGHRFNQADAECFGLDVRLAVDVGARQQVRYVGSVTEKFNAIGNPERGCLRAERRPCTAPRARAGLHLPDDRTSRRDRAAVRVPREAPCALSAAPSCSPG